MEYDDAYALPGIKALIEVRWNYLKLRILFFLLIPYILLLITFSVYSYSDLQSY